MLYQIGIEMCPGFSMNTAFKAHLVPGWPFIGIDDTPWSCVWENYASENYTQMIWMSEMVDSTESYWQIEFNCASEIFKK